MTQEEIIENLKKCPHFNSCNQNLCPLDLELHLRKGGEGDKCRWMRDARKTKVNGREFTTGGSVMPDALLIFVPDRQKKRLNSASQQRWEEVNKK